MFVFAMLCCLWDLDSPIRDGKWVIDHTFTDPAYGGQGIAGKMVQCIAEAAQEKNVIIVPVCSYAAHWFSKHPEYRTEQI